jgi:hypothetical protein
MLRRRQGVIRREGYPTKYWPEELYSQLINFRATIG